MLMIDCYYSFGELKAGDKFALHGLEYEKIAGNTAVRLFDDIVIDITNEFGENPVVYLYELG